MGAGSRGHARSEERPHGHATTLPLREIWNAIFCQATNGGVGLDRGGAIAPYRRAAEILEGHELSVSSTAVAFMQTGRREEVVRTCNELRSRAEHRRVDPFALAVSALATRQVEEALDHLEEGERERTFLVLWVRLASNVSAPAPLRAHPRFHALLHRIWPDDFPAPEAAPAARSGA